jgi:hypothetical protein
MRRLAGVAADASVPHAIRASIGVGSTTADLERFVQALAEIVADGPRWPYELTNGRLVPTPDPRPRPFAGLFP